MARQAWIHPEKRTTSVTTTEAKTTGIPFNTVWTTNLDVTSNEGRGTGGSLLTARINQPITVWCGDATMSLTRVQVNLKLSS